MKILFTGITGNLYSGINKLLSTLPKHIEIYVISRKCNRIFDRNVKYLNIDLDNPFTLNEHFEIIFYGSFILPYTNFINENNYVEINKKMIFNLLNALKSFPNKFIFISTHAINESIYDKKKFLYANTKLTCEKMILEFSKMHSIKYLIIRLPPVINNKLDFKYELIKLNKLITIFPFSKKIQVVFISDINTLIDIYKNVFFSRNNESEIIGFEFSPKINYYQKICWLKESIKRNCFVIFLPFKKSYKIKTELINTKYILIDSFKQLNI